MLDNNNNYTPDSLKRIKDICNSRNWSVYRLAKESGVAYSSLNNMFNRNTEPTLPTLISLCKGLNISLSEFFSDCDLDIVPLNNDTRELLSSYDKLSPRSKYLAKAYIKGLEDRESST
jgi:transcriptional regulator with XRE-family HTH domain